MELITYSIPRDLRKIKTKIMFGLTMRQLLCFLLAAMTGIPVYLYTKPYMGTDLASYLMIAIMCPFVVVALFEKDGFPAEKWLYFFIRKKFLRPEIRVYRTNNFYRHLEQEAMRKEVEDRGKGKKQKRNRTKAEKKTGKTLGKKAVPKKT